MKNKTASSILLSLFGISLTLIGMLALVLYESNELLDLPSIVFAIMIYTGLPIFIVGMILTVLSFNTTKARLIATSATVLFVIIVGGSYGVYMHMSDKNLEAKRDAYDKCDLIKDKKSGLYDSCRREAREMP